MTLKIREPQQFSVDMAWPAFDPAQLSNVPESDTWRAGIVSERSADTGIVDLADGSRIGFVNGQLLRNRTHIENTQVGATVWITERGGISAHPPHTFSARQRYDAMMKEQVQTFSDTVDAQAAKVIEAIYK